MTSHHHVFLLVTGGNVVSANNWSTLTTSAPVNLPSADVGMASNKYASLEGLFSDSTESIVAAPPSQGSAGVNWNAINWSGSTTGSTPGPATGWSSYSQLLYTTY